VSNRLIPELAGTVRSWTSTACSLMAIMACEVSRRAMSSRFPGSGSFVLNRKGNGSISLSDFKLFLLRGGGLLFVGNIVKRRNPLFDIESAKVGRRLPMSASRKSCRKNGERKTRGQKPSESRHCDRTSLGRTTAERRE
jgi:hypothetical protein